MKTHQDLLAVWFEGLDGPDPGAAVRRWYTRDPDFDAQLQADFGDLLATAESGGLQDWESQPASLLALVILLDQFSRNLHRGSGKAFANDVRAVSLANKAVELGWDQQFEPLRRKFFYMPFEHSEEITDQDKAVKLFRQLAEEAGEAHKAQLENFLDYAERHRAIIARFGRFPGRNDRLGRASTDEEIAFLQEPGSSFG